MTSRRSVADPRGSFGHWVQSEHTSALRVVGSGVDSLYVACRGELQDGLVPALTAIRALNSDGDPLVWQFRDNQGFFMPRPHGWRGYPFVLQSPNYELRVGAAKPFPPVYVEMRSTYLHRLGVGEAVAELFDTLSRDVFTGTFAMIPSRIDVYAAVQGWQPSPEDFYRFTCRGVRRRLYEEARQLHTQGSALSGFVFGRGDVVARIYNKTLELARRGETWPRVFWKDADPELPVWRVEFQFRRPALAGFGMAAVWDAVAQRQALWEYGTRWLSLRVPAGDTNRARWPEDAIWQQLRAVEIGLPSSPLVREHVAAAAEVRLIRGLLGYASAFGATRSYDELESVLGSALPVARRYLAQRGVAFSDTVRRKRQQQRATRL